MYRLHFIAILLVTLAATCPAEDLLLAGPVAGFLFDSKERAIRPVVGVPGSSYLGDAIALEVDSAAFSPDGRSALVVRDGRLNLVRGLDRGQPEWLPLEGAMDGIDRIAWGGAGSAFTLSSANRKAQFWKGLSETPELAGVADLERVAGRIVAVTAAGSLAALATGEGEVFAVRPDSAPRLLVRLGQPAGMAIAGSDLLVADRAREEILRIDNFAEAAAVALVAGSGLGISDPVGVAVAGGKLYVASGAGRSVAVFDYPSTDFITRLEVDFEPTRIEPLARSIYILATGDGDNEPVQVLDASQRPAVYFVPARRAGGEE